jgi:hypothetical protein
VFGGACSFVTIEAIVGMSAWLFKRQLVVVLLISREE